MQDRPRTRIEASAASELARWKALFADEVCMQAKRIAAEAGEPKLVTIAHYRQAAVAALQSLSAAIQLGERDDARQKAA